MQTKTTGRSRVILTPSSIVFTQGCLSVTIHGSAPIDIDSLVLQNANNTNIDCNLIYNGIYLFPYTLRDGKRTGTVVYYVSPPMTVMKVAYVIVLKKNGTLNTILCEDLVAKQRRIGPNDNHIAMKFYPKVLLAGNSSHEMKMLAIIRTIDVLDCYLSAGMFVDMKMSHLFQDGPDNIVVGDLDENHFTLPTFPSPTFKLSKGPTVDDALWSVMVLIINTYIYPIDLYKESWVWSKSEQLDLRDDAYRLIKNARKGVKNCALLDIAYDVLDMKIRTLEEVREAILSESVIATRLLDS